MLSAFTYKTGPCRSQWDIRWRLSQSYHHLLWAPSVDYCSWVSRCYHTHLLYLQYLTVPLLCVGIIFTLIIIELIGRKKTMALEFFGAAVFFSLILVCAGTWVSPAHTHLVASSNSLPSIGSGWTTFFLFGARGFVTGVFQAVYVYTPEVYPTRIRGVAMGVNTAAARVGAIITPFVAQVSQEEGRVNEWVCSRSAYANISRSCLLWMTTWRYHCTGEAVWSCSYLPFSCQ